MEAGKLTHSHSQPGGMDRTPPGTPKKGGKMLAVRVQMLDDSITMFQVQAKALGKVLFEQVCNQLHLLESDYFGLEYQGMGGTKYWLDLEKPLFRQIGLSLVDTLVRFCVKFYTPDPSQLEEEFTRYLFCLQIKRDLSQGLLQCNSNTAALLASYIVQAECGDYVVEDYPDHRYLSSYKFVPNQDQELERKIMENHKKHSGQSPAEADLNLLETARRCELYGIKMHPAKDHEGAPLNLAVAHMGIVVFQNFTKINTFSWAKIRKLSFKRKRFLVKLHPEGYGHYKDTVEFFFEGRNECKNFWKKCVENHGFFRCTMVKKVPRQKTRVLSRGSSFRYSGRTQKQIVDFVRENYVKRQTFQRSQSFRHSSSAHSSVANVGTSISAHPLLPLGDNAVAGTPASLSCGSMTLTSSPLHTVDIHAGGSPSPPLTTSVSPGTSVTSSPQHFYPQETPYRRAGRQLMKTKLPPGRSHRAISPLQSPTDAATSANNHSANHFNSSNNSMVDGTDIKSSRVSLKSPDNANFNDVYSTCYSSLRGSRNNIENKIIDDDEIKNDLFNLGEKFVNSPAMNNESIRSVSKKLKPFVYEKDEKGGRYTWHRSASCKDLYHEENVVTDDKDYQNENLDPGYDIDINYEYIHNDDSRRKCYSAVASKNPSVEQTGEVMSDMKIYSSSYPGTTSSLSTESAEAEAELILDIIAGRYESQEDMVLSHDDISHDSYELLERELESYNDGAAILKNKRVITENERARSCSWGSDKGVGPIDSRSTENVIISGYGGTDESFWSLERERSPKHKSEADFRSLNYRTKEFKTSRNDNYRLKVDDEDRRTREFLDYDSRCVKRMKEANDEIYGLSGQLDNRLFGSNYVENELFKNYEKDLRHSNLQTEDGYEALQRKKYHSWTKSLEELMGLSGDSDEGIFKRKQIRNEDKKRMERRKREKDERFHEGIKEKEQKEWERERERRQIDRKKMMEEKMRREEETSRKMQTKTNDYANFQEIQCKKFDRVISNQFGKYSEFLPQENIYERKVMENYEKICEVGRMAKELKENEKNALANREHRKAFPEKLQENIQGQQDIITTKGLVDQFQECEKVKSIMKWGASPKSSPRSGKALVERTKSDPFNHKNQRRNILMHQKSIDLTPQQSEETTSDYDHEDGLKKTSRSEHDIPYILHKRHCMNGTAKATDFKTDFKTSLKPTQKELKKPQVESKKSNFEEISKHSPENRLLKKASPGKMGENKKLGVQIINLDLKTDGSQINIIEPKKTIKSKPAGKKSESKILSPKPVIKKEIKKIESPKAVRVVEKAKKEEAEVPKVKKIAEKKEDKPKEPIYAEVCKEKIEPPESFKKSPPEPPRRTTSVEKKISTDEKKEKSLKPLTETNTLPKIPKRSSSIQKPETIKEIEIETGPNKEAEVNGDFSKVQVSTTKSKPDLPVLKRREESLILFARTRLGLSEGSAFTPVVRQGHVRSLSTARRTKSLDAPYVSVHSLPPVDAFSSKDDTVDSIESDVVHSAVTKAKESFKTDLKTAELEPQLKAQSGMDTTVSTESDLDSVFTDNLEADSNFKKTVESQSKVEIAYTEEKVLDSVRNKRLLSKIESVDVIDSEGDLDSSKLADPIPIPVDRLVNLPESIRFPSVRQISGQTSEESADGWDQKEVKVKRRTPRRSIGREEIGNDIKESVVWDSKDEELPDDDVWDDNLVFTGKYEGSSITDAVVPIEYLKRGSCGQSIDDDNLSTPMKESSPEHWVSVDDLPEALEREEKLLRQQEKILREKILNEKLKRELNLDTFDFDERYYEHKDNYRQKYEEDTLLKDKFKGHSLDTYELKEKKLRERGTIKNSSLDEHLLGEKPIKNYNICSSLDSDDKSSYENVVKATNYPDIDFIQCKVVNDVMEIDQFGDNDEDLEEFFVVLDENLGNEKGSREMIWDESEQFRTLSKDESLISVPEEFKDVEKESEDVEGKPQETITSGQVEIRLSEAETKGQRLTGEEHILACQLLQEKLDKVVLSEKEDELHGSGDIGRLSPFSGSRRGSEEHKKMYDDTGRLSPYDCSSRRSSEDPRRLSASDDPGRLTPFNDSRRGSEDPRRLSTSEDSRKYSMSESVSEETRRRLSSTEETRRKRASLTKQCSVGADSLSDEMISGIQECSSSFEHDEKDVFEAEPVKSKEVVEIKQLPSTIIEKVESPKMKKLEIEVSEDTSIIKEDEKPRPVEELNGTHLAPPTSERELSRETEDSVDYQEGDFKDIRETVKDKDISDGLICDNEPLKLELPSNLPSSFEKSESSDVDELRYIDEKRGSTPEILIGKSKEAVAMSIVVVNEGISVLNKISDNGQWLNEAAEAHSLPRELNVKTVDRGDEERHTLPKKPPKPKPLTPKPVDHMHRKLGKVVPNVKVETAESFNVRKSSLDSSQESELDKLGDLSLISYVHSQIARRNLSDTGKGLRNEEFEFMEKEDKKTSSEEEGMPMRTSSEEREKTESSSFELKSSADELYPSEDNKWRPKKGEKKFGLKSAFEGSKKKDFGVGKGKRSPEQEKRDSGEDGSSSSSAPPYPKRELSSTWKPFLLESSGSSSLEEGWLPPDDNAHLADEEETSSTSNNQQDDSYHEDIDYPTGIGYPVLNMPNAEMMIGGYGSVYALSRTLSRISERSTSEQERSDVEDDITKPTSHSVSSEEGSILSSDHQPSLSSDSPSPKEVASGIPDLPDDRPAIEDFALPEKPICEPFGDVIPPPVPDDDWPSPPSSSSVVDTPVVSHIETFYIEIHPEEACKVVVAEPHNEGNSSSDENHTLQEESEFLHLSSDNISASTTTTTQDGTVIVAIRPKSMRTGSVSEDTSIVSTSDWSNSVIGNIKHKPSYGEELSKGSNLQDLGNKVGFKRSIDDVSDWSVTCQPSPVSSKYYSEGYPEAEQQKPKIPPKIKPPKLVSPTTKNIGFFETPVSKVRSPTSQMRFFESGDRNGSYGSIKSPTSHSETTSPKNYGRFFDTGAAGSSVTDLYDLRPSKGKYTSRREKLQTGVCTPYYSNVAESAEKSYFGRYDTGSLERTKIHSSRKCCSYYSVSRATPHEEDSDGSNSEGPPPPPSPNTIPRASKKSRRRHRVAMDLEIRDGKIVAPPKTRSSVIDNSDSDRSSPREFVTREVRKKHSDV